ncbi:uncharacterized protein LOC120651084 isoform X2 [Panicum virgatum]|uniref:uncharacterized protein LOC120651084 isoform X2 n=1 Tax=Panicum virgatum TaxID=38727 RepID=UPI0019D66D57|nr:uncharacterized protein LOC120651084 isoform X2 [Panicum virgatum]
MATPSKRLHPAPGSGGASVAGYAGLEHPNVAGVFGNPGFIMTDEVGSYECSVTRNGQPIPPECEIVSIDRHTRVMSCAAGVAFDYLEQSSAFYLMDADDPNTCCAKQVNETEKHNVASDSEASADVDVTKTNLTDGCCHDADVIVFGATGKPLQALDKDQLAEGKGAFMTIGKVGKIKQRVASLAVSSDSGISSYSVHGTKLTSPLREAKKESAEIGSCRFDLTSVAALSCVELDGSWRPPSMSCCNALLYAIDHVPASNESGVCCLCRYMSQKYSHFALAVSYVLCKGKDRSIVTTWSSVPHNCYTVCRRRNASFLAVDTPAVVSVLGTRSKDFRIPWIAALVVAAFCAIMLASCYHWWCKPTATGESQPLNLQCRGLPSKAREEQKPSRRHSSSLRRLSSRDSPNG